MEAGEYIERIFPFLGVRFIAINDHYDSLHRNPESDELVIPFKNLINEAYCRDTSIKVRSQLEIKRQRGDFIGSFAVFGYQKDPNDHHKLIADEYAADVVRDIFRWKLNGIGIMEIANRLNAQGVPTPLEYKKRQGMKYNTPFRVKSESVWSAKMVLRILQNPVYIGTLEQGRFTTPSYKVKRLINKPREDWAVTENAHEAIIDSFDFDTIQKVLSLDTHTGVPGQAVDKFGGMVYCGECGAPMVRKTIPSGKRKYVYYVCAAHKTHKTCYPHSLRDTTLDEIVLELVREHIKEVVGLAELLGLIDVARLQQASMRKLQERLAKKQEEIDHCQMLLRSLYENLASGIIDREEYLDLKASYSTRHEEAKAQAAVIERQIESETDLYTNNGWMEQFRAHQRIGTLDRAVVVTLIEHILVYREHRVEIVFRWENEFRLLLDLVTRAQHLLPGEEAV